MIAELELAALAERAAAYLSTRRAARRAVGLALPIRRLDATLRSVFRDQRRDWRRHAVAAAAVREDAGGNPTPSLVGSPAGVRVRAGVRTAGGAALVAGADRVGYDLGVGVALDLADPRAVAWLEDRGAELVTRIDDATRADMRDLLTRAAYEGWSTDVLSANVADAYAFSDSRARTIARTEMAYAHAEGAREGADQLDAAGLELEKQWLVNEPEDEECIANGEAGWIALGDEFPSGDDAPPVHPNCECDVAFRASGVKSPSAIAISPQRGVPTQTWPAVTKTIEDDVVARRRRGETFASIGAIYGVTGHGTWARRIVKRVEPELLGPPRAKKIVPPAPPDALGPRRPAPGPDWTWDRLRQVWNPPAPPPGPPSSIVGTGVGVGRSDWWNLQPAEIEEAYPWLKGRGTSDIGRTVAISRAMMRAAESPGAKTAAESLASLKRPDGTPVELPPQLRDIKVAPSGADPELYWPAQTAQGFMATLEVEAGHHGSASLRPPPVVVLTPTSSDMAFTIAHELGHQAAYLSGVPAPSGVDFETIANLYGQQLLGRPSKAESDARAGHSRFGIETPPTWGKTDDFTLYGREWKLVRAEDRAYLARVLAAPPVVGNVAFPPRRIDYQRAGIVPPAGAREAARARATIVFGPYRCLEGIAWVSGFR